MAVKPASGSALGALIISSDRSDPPTGLTVAVATTEPQKLSDSAVVQKSYLLESALALVTGSNASANAVGSMSLFMAISRMMSLPLPLTTLRSGMN